MKVKVLRYSFIVLSMILLGACGSSGPARGPLHFEEQSFDEYATDDELFDEPATKANDSNAAAECTITVAAIRDKRHRPKSFGTSNNFEKFAETIPQWVKEGLRSLSGESQPNPANTNISLNVEILKAYIHNYATAKNANLVMRINFNVADHSDSRVYRGSDTSINWNNSPEEVESAMNTAFSRLLQQLSEDLEAFCSTV